MFTARSVLTVVATNSNAVGADSTPTMHNTTKVGATRSIITIPLDKQSVPVVRNGVTVTHRTAYFGTVHFGVPVSQPFTVLFDTGSGHVFLPSQTCASESCSKHRHYQRADSASAVDINYDGTVVGLDDTERDEISVAYGTGEIFGGFIRETVCLAKPEEGIATDACVDVRVILATEMSSEPFSAFRFDGVIGLGLPSLSLDPQFNFFTQMVQTASLPDARFGYFLSHSDLIPSEISFGGHDPRRVSSDLLWAPVHRPELGYWQVQILSVTVGGKPLEACQEGDCTAIADTGTSLLGVPKRAFRGLHLSLARKVPGGDAQQELDCRNFQGPELVFVLRGGVRLVLGPEDYSRAAAMRVSQNSTNATQVLCRASLMPVDPDPALGNSAWILGEPVLRKYYTVYDWLTPKVGFASAVQPPLQQQHELTELARNGSNSTSHSVVGAPAFQALSSALVHV